jgi:hypothetical protein
MDRIYLTTHPHPPPHQQFTSLAAHHRVSTLAHKYFSTILIDTTDRRVPAVALPLSNVDGGGTQ